MRLLLDQGLPRSAADLLSKAGIDTVHVGEIGYSTAEDTAILPRAPTEDRVVVTLDADFHGLLAHYCRQSVLKPRKISRMALW